MTKDDAGTLFFPVIMPQMRPQLISSRSETRLAADSAFDIESKHSLGTYRCRRFRVSYGRIYAVGAQFCRARRVNTDVSLDNNIPVGLGSSPRR